MSKLSRLQKIDQEVAHTNQIPMPAGFEHRSKLSVGEANECLPLTGATHKN